MNYRWTVCAVAACLGPLLASSTVAANKPANTQMSALANRPSAPVPTLNWTPCAEFPGSGIECTTAKVPLDYDNPSGATTELVLARVPATDQANRIGTIFINPGGPGGSGVDLAVFGFGSSLEQQLQGRFDVVGFDPRGIARSSPLQCFDFPGEALAYISSVPIFPYLREQERPFFDVFRGLARICSERRVPIMQHMSTADVVRDLDLLRRAVGDEKLTYLGFSYGSYIGNTYANMFPQKVRALVIDGVLDPRLWSSGTQIVSDRVATAEEFAEFLRLCDEAGDACALSAPGGSSARFEALANALLETPLLFPGGFLYTYDLLISDATTAMYAPETWGGPDGYAAMFDFLADAVLGDASATQQAAATRRTIEQRLQQARPQRADYDNFIEGYYGNQCSDTGYPHSFLAFHAVSEFAEAGSIFGPYWWWPNAGCANWPVAADRYVGPWTTRTSAPVLVVGNYFDGVTDYNGAVASSRLLKNSRLLSYAGWGHTAYDRSECVTQYVIDYLLDGSLPPVDTVCPANPNPFLTVAQDRVAPRLPMIGLPPPKPGRYLPMIGLPPPKPGR